MRTAGGSSKRQLRQSSVRRTNGQAREHASSRGASARPASVAVLAGSLPVERVITSSVTLDAAPDAFARLASGAADEIKVLIEQ